jgi:hypothetical protein
MGFVTKMTRGGKGKAGWGGYFQPVAESFARFARVIGLPADFSRRRLGEGGSYLSEVGLRPPKLPERSRAVPAEAT